MAGVNEPPLPQAIKRSFLFVNSVGMRIAPELLVAELSREVFCDSVSDPETRKDRALDPDELYDNGTLDRKSYAAAYCVRGRKKLKKQDRVNSFFAPVYPELSRFTAQRPQSDRVIKHFFLGGPIAQHVSERPSEEKERLKREIITELVTALYGSNRRNVSEEGRVDVADAMNEEVDAQVECGASEQRAYDILEEPHGVFAAGANDPLAELVCEDLREILRLEKRMPRFEWLRVFMGFLRLVIPLWMLAQMRMTVLLRGWIGDMMRNEDVPSEKDLMDRIRNRNLDIFVPTRTPSTMIQRHIKTYMRSRIELSIIFSRLSEIGHWDFNKLVLTATGNRSGEVSIEKVLTHVRSTPATAFTGKSENNDFESWLSECASRYAAWSTPLRRGQGKNIDELIRVLYKASDGDVGGSYLLIREKIPGQNTQGFRVFPGPRLLQCMVHLAAARKRKHGRPTSPLVLDDVERQLANYGINFRNAADARPDMLRELARSGLLAGSPDAGVHARVREPYGA